LVYNRVRVKIMVLNVVVSLIGAGNGVTGENHQPAISICPNRVQYPLLSKQNIYISNKEGIT
jgi:hypothetical protein